jgi:predicted nucleic acid-binding protein
MVVIDTNVLFAAVCPKDPTHEPALQFLSTNTDELHAPEILKVELMSLLARKFDLAIGELYYKELTAGLNFEENARVEVLIEFVKHKKVRGCDAFFAYLADQLGVKIVSFDKDLISKTNGFLLR